MTVICPYSIFICIFLVPLHHHPDLQSEAQRFLGTFHLFQFILHALVLQQFKQSTSHLMEQKDRQIKKYFGRAYFIQNIIIYIYFDLIIRDLSPLKI